MRAHHITPESGSIKSLQVVVRVRANNTSVNMITLDYRVDHYQHDNRELYIAHYPIG